MVKIENAEANRISSFLKKKNPFPLSILVSVFVNTRRAEVAIINTSVCNYAPAPDGRERKGWES